MFEKEEPFILLNDPLHKCDLPDVNSLPLGQWVQCMKKRRSDGVTVVCKRKYVLSERGFWKRSRFWDPYYPGRITF